jgi:hypothetical protein
MDAHEAFPDDLAADILKLNLADFQPKNVAGTSNWYLDSGASAHATSDKAAITNVKDSDTGCIVKTAGGQTLPAAGNGNVTLNLANGIKETVLYVPGMRKNLLSVGSLADQGLSFLFGKHSVIVLNTKRKVIGQGTRDLTNGLYTLPTLPHPSAPTKLNSSITTLSNTHLWHQRLGHVNNARLRFMLDKKVVSGLAASLLDSMAPCHACIQGKQPRERAPKSSDSRAKIPLDLIHLDVCDPLQIPSLSSACYFLTFIDDCSRFCWIYFIKQKSDVFDCFKQFQSYIEGAYGYKIHTLHSDGGREYSSSCFRA